MNRPKTHKHNPLPEHAEKVFEGKRWHVYQWKQEQFDGSVRTFEALKRKDTVIVFLIIGEKVVILEEEQPHWGRKSDSIIAGEVEDGEDIFDAANRELLEETGMVFENLYLVHSEQRMHDIHSTMHVFIAKDLKETKEKRPDVGEKIEIKEVTFSELITLARERKFFHRPWFVDEYIVRDTIPDLFELFKNPQEHLWID